MEKLCAFPFVEFYFFKFHFLFLPPKTNKLISGGNRKPHFHVTISFYKDFFHYIISFGKGKLRKTDGKKRKIAEKIFAAPLFR